MKFRLDPFAKSGISAVPPIAPVIVGGKPVDVTSVKNSDGSLTVSPNTGDVVVSLATPVSIANGGTGSVTQNFVDLSSNQASIGGSKTFLNNVSFKAANPFATGTYNLGTSSLYWANLYATTLNLNSTFSISGSSAGLGTITGQLKFAAGTTGSGSAALGANSPAVTNTAPYTWLQVTASDGSQLYVPAWK